MRLDELGNRDWFFGLFGPFVLDRPLTVNEIVL